VRHWALLVAALLGACAEAPPDLPHVPGAAPSADYLHGADWPSYNRDLAGTRYSPLTAINRTNVDELRQAWSYPLGAATDEARAGSELTPLVVGGLLYASAADRVVALRAHTGEEVWRFVVEQGAASRRGLAYWPGDETTTARLFFTVGDRLVALEAATGSRAPGFGAGGEVEMAVTYGGAPTRFEDSLIVGSSGPPGGVRAFDARTGAERWTFGAEAALLHPAYSVTVDVDRALLYAVFAGPEGDPFYGGDRKAGSAIENSIVALDARTGEPRWQFQIVRHDIWDYDLAAPPVLLDATIAGQRVPVLAQAAPTGYLYVLNRVTGKPVLPLVETPAPASDVPGEQSAPMQPIPAAPPPLARVSYATVDLVTARDTTAEHAAFCRELRDRSGGLQNSGPFTPYRYRAEGDEPRSTIVFPGSIGAVTWGGAAADPSRGLVFVNTNSEGGIGWIGRNSGDAVSAQTGQARNERLPYRRTSAVGGPLARFWWRDAAADSGGNEQNGDAAAWPCQKPPWGELAAVDVATGAVVWQVPLGITAELPEGRKRTGRLNLGGPIATAAGLVFIGATNDRRFRAFDSRTGAELWVTELPLSAHAVPIAYGGDDGKQYVAVVAGGGSSVDDPGAPDAQSLIAYALP
jgi:quinoprotein glucose dehydrogenase